MPSKSKAKPALAAIVAETTENANGYTVADADNSTDINGPRLNTATDLPADSADQSDENTATDTATENTDAATDKATQRNAARNAARALFLAADSAVSVPVKAMLAFKAYRATLGALRCNNPTTRQAAALAVACLASGQAMPTDATAPSVTFGRVFDHPVTNDICAIENGCAADCVSTGLAAYDTATASFTISGKQAIAIRGLIGKRLSDIATPAPAPTA